jgi:hypothetical protein
MPTLTIDLQDGFADDDVIVCVNGKEVERRSGVRTKRMLGLAQSMAITVPDGPFSIEVRVTTRGISGRTEVRHTQLGVSLSDKDVQFVQSDKQFGYS